MARFNQSDYPDAHTITGAEVENYLYAMVPPRDEVLTVMEKQAIERRIPIVGPIVGKLFQLLAHMIGAKTVFELGSAIGYSTIWWARAVGEGGRVHYTDGSAQNAQEASEGQKGIKYPLLIANARPTADWWSRAE